MKFYVTTPIYYVNDKPHLGHLYSTLAADILARYHRFIGDEVLFLTGTDEHGSKIAAAAAKHHQTPQAFADVISTQFKQVWTSFDVSYDRFIRTTDVEHIDTVKQFLQTLYDKHFIYKGEYHGLYCQGCEEFKKTADLIDNKCPLHNTVPENVSEPAYFFKLSAFQTELTKIIAHDELKVWPVIRKNEVLGFLENETLEDIAISRLSVDWGVPLPWDKSHTVYVWVDALINYYTARGDFWPPTWHIVGKDILRFHCVIWPAMLLAAGLALPNGVFVHGFFTIDGQKMSKSLKNGVDPNELLQRYTPDTLRYFLFRGFPFGADGDFSYSLLDEVYNSALANSLGNLVQRVQVMAEKYFGGTVPSVNVTSSNIETAVVNDSWRLWSEALDTLQIDEAFKAVWDLVRFANQRIDETKPWDLAKSDMDGLSEALYEQLEIIRHIGLQLKPLMPDTAQKIAATLNIDFADHYTAPQFDQMKKWGKLASGTNLVPTKALFPRKD